MPNCTPEQCADLQALLIALQAGKLEAEAQVELLHQEIDGFQMQIETVQGCLDYCECQGGGQGERAAGPELTPKQRAIVDMLLRLYRMLRGSLGASPKKVE